MIKINSRQYFEPSGPRFASVNRDKFSHVNARQKMVGGIGQPSYQGELSSM